MLVVEDDESRYLRFDNSFQSGMWLDDPIRTRFAYTDYLHLGIAYRPDAKRVLVIGLGGGSAQKRLRRDFDDVEVRRRARPRCRRRRLPLVRAPRDPRLRSWSRTAAGSCGRTSGAGT